jgi:predicted RNA-binding protein with PUA-like domain
MPACWLLKTEPSEYSFDQLTHEKRTVWEGVTNNLALKHLRSMKKGDLAFVYHTGDEKAVVGIAEVASDPYPDPRKNDAKLVVIDLKPRERLSHPVTLEQIKADRKFARFDLATISRLSVMPVSQPIWDAILKMAK